MSLLDKLYDETAWAEFAQYKSSHGNLSEKELAGLLEYISQKKYLPSAGTLEFSIPQKGLVNKSGSLKKRVIYTYGDDQTWVLKMLAWLLYKYDHVFCKSCYSFRHDSCAHMAIHDVIHTPQLDEKWVLKLDIHNYFNSMPSQMLAQELEKVITDDAELLDFLKRFFTLDKCECAGEIICENRGAMAGVPLSAFCANLYLSDLDKRFEQMGVPYFRYSDDILLLADTQQQALRFYELIKSHIVSKGLSLNDEKFSLTPPHSAWDFLGFKYEHGKIDLADASIRKMKAKIKRKAAKLLRWKTKRGLDGDKAARAMIKVFERKFYGGDSEHDFTWSRWYFPVLNTDKGLHTIDEYLVQNIRFLYTGRHYKGNYKITYAHIKSLGYKSLVNEFHKFRKNRTNDR